MIKKLINLFMRLFNNYPDGSWNIELEEKERDERDAIFNKIFGSIEFGGKSKDWRHFVSKLEIQSFGDCVSFSRTNNAEVTAKAKNLRDHYGKDWNFSDVDLAVGSGTTSNGNSLKRVAKYAKKIGISLERDIPYTRDWNKRLQLFKDGQSKTKYKFGNYSEIRPPTTNNLKNALDYSPVQVGIGLSYNWKTKGIIRKPTSYQFYHAINLLYIDDEGNKHIQDSYFPQIKVLDKNYPILFAMSFKDLPENWRSINTEAELIYKRYIGKLVIRAEVKKGGNGELYRIYENYIQKVNFHITDKQLFDETTKDYWRKAKKFNGISERVFAELEKVAFTMQGVKTAEERIDLKGLIN